MATFSSTEKTWFILSLTVLAFGYGFVSYSQGLFPKSYMVQGWEQARDLYGVPKLKTQVYDRSGAFVKQPEKMQPGLTLITSWWNWDGTDGVIPGAKLIDRDGNTVHAWRPDRSTLFPNADVKGDPLRADYDGSHLFPNGDVLLIFEYIGAVRVDACGTVQWRLAEGAHHYISRAEDGSFWIPGTSAERGTTTPRYPNGVPGVKDPVWFDQLLHVSADGDLLQKINVLDVLYANDLERYILKGHGPYPGTLMKDPVHLNDVEPLSATMADEYPLFEAGDLLVSLRHANLVLVVDPTSKNVKWHASRPFLHQHDPDFTGDGWIGVFDNRDDVTKRGAMLGGSRIVSLQPHTDSMRVRFPTPQSDPFYTGTQGQWEELANGNLLLTESNAGRVVEVDSAGRTVWEWIQKPAGTWLQRPSDESTVPVVTGASRYDLTRKEVASWPCSSID